MKRGHVAIVAISGVMLVMIGQADSIRTLNPALLYGIKDSLMGIHTRANAFLEKENATKEAQLKKNATPESKEGFCTPEFDPVPIAEALKMPKGTKDISKIIKKLGQPCKEDGDAIYYLTDSGKVIGYDKTTGAGFYEE